MASSFDLINEIDLLNESQLLTKLGEYGHTVKIKGTMTDNQKLVNRKMLKHLVAKEFRENKFNQTMIPTKKKGSIGKLNLNATFNTQSTTKRNSFVGHSIQTSPITSTLYIPLEHLSKKHTAVRSASKDLSPPKATSPVPTKLPAKKRGRTKKVDKKEESSTVSEYQHKASKIIVMEEPENSATKKSPGKKMGRSKSALKEKMMEVSSEKLNPSSPSMLKDTTAAGTTATAGVGRKRGRPQTVVKNAVVTQNKEVSKKKVQEDLEAVLPLNKKKQEKLESPKTKRRKETEEVEVVDSNQSNVTKAPLLGKKKGRAKVTVQPVIQKKARGRGRKISEVISLVDDEEEEEEEKEEEGDSGGDSGNDAGLDVRSMSTQISIPSPEKLGYKESRLNVECVCVTTGQPMQALKVVFSTQLNSRVWDSMENITEEDGTCATFSSSYWIDRCKLTIHVGDWFKSDGVECSMPIIELHVEKQEFYDHAVQLLIGPNSFSSVIRKTA